MAFVGQLGPYRLEYADSVDLDLKKPAAKRPAEKPQRKPAAKKPAAKKRKR